MFLLQPITESDLKKSDVYAFGGSNCDLSWEQKLKICIGAARGLDYLHTGTRHGIVHRDVKTTNILLDNEWVAKVSDFGLCKFGTKNQSHVSTNVKGTFGYMDPEYFLTRRLTKKSDVYAFGVVLLEVLCERPAVDTTLSEERHSLALWAQHCIKEGKIDELVDPNLRNQISSHCLKIFTEVAYKCLHNRPIGRPTMSDVVVSLECALIPQNCNGESTTSVQNEEEEEASDDDNDDDLTFETVQSDGAPQQEHENMLATNKRSKWNLRKALKWSYGLLTKRKKDSDSFSDRLQLDSDSDSFSDKLQQEHENIPFRRFLIEEIRAATNNFDSKLKISEGGFGPMYKGWIDNGTLEVAIEAMSEFTASSRAEIAAQSQLPHLHVIGYCDDRGKLMLVYSYMVNRSLDDQLYGPRIRHSPLPWTKRLEICIGAAKGLQYLPHGTTQKTIHCNIKPSNILLDDNWVAKIFDFELAKVAMLDAFRGRLTEKSDVYAFGVVLLGVVCAQKPYYSAPDDFEDQEILVHWFRNCLGKKTIDQLIDPYLIGRISPECLMQYLKVAWNCLHYRGTERPTMNTVVENLEIALQLQQAWYIDAEIDVI